MGRKLVFTIEGLLLALLLSTMAEATHTMPRTSRVRSINITNALASGPDALWEGGSRFQGWGGQCGEGRRQGRRQPGLGSREDWIQEATEGVSLFFSLSYLSSYPAVWGHSPLLGYS